MPVTVTLEELTKKFPILTDPQFAESYPNILEVALCLYEVSQEPDGTEQLMKGLGTTNICEYLGRIKQGDRKAVEFYSGLTRQLELSKLMFVAGQYPQDTEDCHPEND